MLAWAAQEEETKGDKVGNAVTFPQLPAEPAAGTVGNLREDEAMAVL